MSRRNEPGALQEINLYPPGVGLYLLATLSMVVAHACLLLSVYTLLVMPIPNHEESAGLIMLVAAASLFLIIHPSFMITRGWKGALRLLGFVSAAYTVMLALVLAWSFYNAESLTYFAALGALLSGAGLIAYRGDKLETLRKHYAGLWGRD